MHEAQHKSIYSCITEKFVRARVKLIPFSTVMEIFRIRRVCTILQSIIFTLQLNREINAHDRAPILTAFVLICYKSSVAELFLFSQ